MKWMKAIRNPELSKDEEYLKPLHLAAFGPTVEFKADSKMNLLNLIGIDQYW
jgi:hypothetical protein